MRRSQYIMTNNPHEAWRSYCEQDVLHTRAVYKNYSEMFGMKIKNVLFRDPATIVFWTDGTKTVVKADGETYDPEKGLAMAIAKKALGNQGNYYNEFKKWLPEEEDVEPIYPAIPAMLLVNEYAKEACKKLGDIMDKRIERGILP